MHFGIDSMIGVLGVRKLRENKRVWEAVGWHMISASLSRRIPCTRILQAGGFTSGGSVAHTYT